MDLARSDEQQAIVESARDFGRERIAPHAAGWEAVGTMPREMPWSSPRTWAAQAAVILIVRSQRIDVRPNVRKSGADGGLMDSAGMRRTRGLA
jgi:hypothetical protein